MNIGFNTKSFSDLLKTDAGASNMKVDGSAASKVFHYSSDSTVDISVRCVRFVFSASSFIWNGAGFGKNSSGITNGILVQGIVNDGSSIDFMNIKMNEDFLRLPDGIVDSAGATVVLAVTLTFGEGTILKANTSDKIKVTIQDDLTGSLLGVNYLSATLYGEK